MKKIVINIETSLKTNKKKQNNMIIYVNICQCKMYNLS